MDHAIQRRLRQGEPEKARHTRGKIGARHGRIQSVGEEGLILSSSPPGELSAKLSLTRQVDTAVHTEALEIITRGQGLLSSGESITPHCKRGRDRQRIRYAKW